MITAAALSKFYATQKAIDQVSFEIGEGEIVGLLGLNGAGKSTILKILGCFLLPSTGTASVAGFSVEDDPYQVRGLVGYLPDTPPLYDEMTVRKYLNFVAKLKNVESSNLATYVNDAINKTNVDDVADEPLGSLSHGYRQRVGIAQAVVHKPKVLILDEPINGLDPVQIVEMRDLILSFKGEHTVILSSHILSEITRTCDRILIVDKGKLVAEGSESELRQGNVGSGAMTISCELANINDSYLAMVKQISGVTGVNVLNGQLEVTMQGDQRAALAKTLVSGGGELLAMNRAGDELENLFMKFVRS